MERGKILEGEISNSLHGELYFKHSYKSGNMIKGYTPAIKQ